MKNRNRTSGNRKEGNFLKTASEKLYLSYGWETRIC